MTEKFKIDQNLELSRALLNIQELAAANPDLYSLECVERVSKYIEREVCFPHWRKQYRFYFREIEDFKLYFSLHPEWHDMTADDLLHNPALGGESFYKSLRDWAKERSDTRQEQRKYIDFVLPASNKRKIWPQEGTIEDWILEAQTAGVYGLSPHQATQSKEGSLFLQAFYNWVDRNVEHSLQEKRELRSQIFKYRTQSWSHCHSIEDFVYEYLNHPEWHEKTLIELQYNKKLQANGFLQTVSNFIRELSTDPDEKKRLTNLIFSRQPGSPNQRDPSTKTDTFRTSLRKKRRLRKQRQKMLQRTEDAISPDFEIEPIESVFLKAICIYALINPLSGEVFYIGKTNNLYRRIKEHTQRGEPSQVIKHFRALGYEPAVGILEHLNQNQDWSEREMQWINYGRQEGWPLVNHPTIT